MLGHPAAAAIGQSVELIIPPHLRDPHNVGFARFVETGTSRLPEVVTTSALHAGGAIVKLLISVAAVRGPGGAIVAVDATMRPVEPY